MDNYESRIYAIALRAPVTTYHTEEVEDDLCSHVESKIDTERTLMKKLVRMCSDKKYKRAPIPEGETVELSCGSFWIDRTTWILSHTWVEGNYNNESVAIMNQLDEFKKALAAIEYAKNTINTPHEVVVLSLPVNKDISRAILGMDQFKELANNYLQKEINEEEAFTKMKEFLQKLAPYEYKKESAVSDREALEKEETLVTNFDVPNKTVETEEEPSFFAKALVVVGIICAIIAVMSLL